MIPAGRHDGEGNPGACGQFLESIAGTRVDALRHARVDDSRSAVLGAWADGRMPATELFLLGKSVPSRG
jgi:hypothetical protein